MWQERPLAGCCRALPSKGDDDRASACLVMIFQDRYIRRSWENERR